MSGRYVLTSAELAWLHHAQHNGRFDWAACSGRGARRAVAERLVARGLLREEQCVSVDADGFTIQPERWGTGYRLTEAGAALVRGLDDCERALMNARMAASDATKAVTP